MAQNSNQFQPIHAAAGSGQVQTADFLLRNGANVEASIGSGMRPVHLACQFGHVDMLRFLLNYGADAEATTGEGQSGSDIAIANNYTHLVDILKVHAAGSSLLAGSQVCTLFTCRISLIENYNIDNNITCMTTYRYI